MSVQIVLDKTQEYLTGSESGTPNLLKLDIGGFDYAVVQFAGVSGPSITFFHTNDSGAIQGVSDGSAVASQNPILAQAVNLSNGSGVTSASADGLFRFQSGGQYLWLDDTSGSVIVSKLLVRLYKIH